MQRLSLLAFSACLVVALTGCDAVQTEADFASMTDAELTHALQGVAADDLPEDAGCRTVDAWVAANPALIPSELSGLRSLPANMRAAATASLSPDAASRVWKARLAEAVPALHPGQAREIRRIRSALTPEWFLRASEFEDEGELTAFIESTIGTHEALEEAFGDLAPSLFNGIDRLDASGGEDASAIALQGGSCGCSTNSDYCGVILDCSGGGCEKQRFCGFLFAYTCNGACRVPG